MGNYLSGVAIVFISVVSAFLAHAQELPLKVGTCATTGIARLEHRLSDEHGNFAPDSGSAVSFKNHGYQVSYDEVPAVHNAEINDPVIICLIKLPKNCPAGDHRGRFYTTTDLRTMESWTMPDAEHGCGGA